MLDKPRLKKMRKPASIMVSVLLLISIPWAMSVVPIAQTSAGTATSPLMRVGLDLAWYATNGFGSLHGVNCAANATTCYEYLTHGWKDSGGLADGTCPNGGCSGGFFTAYRYDIENPPLGVQGNAYISNEAWFLQFIAAANADHDGTQAKIFIGMVLENNFDATLYGAMENFLNRLGPVQDNPAVAGFEFRGAQEGIQTRGGAKSGGCEGSNFIPSNVAYGLSGMDSFPQNSSQEARMWNEVQTKVNAYGYTLGISTGLSDMDTCVTPKDYSDNLAQFFVQGTTIYPSVTAPPNASYTDNLNTFYDAVASPPRAASVSVGTVFGEWDPNWFVPNYPQSGYYATQYGIQSSLQGFSEGAAVNPSAGQYWFIYGMPYLTNDDSASIAKHGPCPFLPWILQYATEYGFFTDFSSSLTPGTITPVTPPNPPYTLAPTGLYIHIIGDSSLDSQKPRYSQTDPVHCCGTDKYYIQGRLVTLSDGEGVADEQIHILEFNYTTDLWGLVMLDGAPLVVTTDSNGYYGGAGSIGTIVIPSPPMPGTTREQAYFYPAFLGDSTYGPSNGVLEDLPILAAGVTTTTTTTSTSTTTSTTATTTTSTQTTTTSATSTQSRTNFSLALSSPSATGVLGSVIQVTASVVFPNGNSQPVSFSTSNPPAGVVVSFSTVQYGSGAVSLMTFNITTSAIPGVYPIDIRATVDQATESKTFILTVQSSMLVTYSLSVSVSPSDGGTTSLIPGTYTVPGGESVNVTAYPAQGWSLDHWTVNGQYGGNGTSTRLLITANSSLQAVFARGAQAPGLHSVIFSSSSSLNESIIVDGVKYSLPVSFSWQEGSQHEIETAPVIYDSSQTRRLFIGWTGYPFSSRPVIDFVVFSSPSYDLSPSYLVQSKTSFSFTDCKGSVISPTDVVVQDSAGNTMSLNSSSRAWLDAGVTYQVVQADWMGVNVAGTSSGLFIADGPAVHQQQLRVCDAYIRITDVFGFPTTGASVVMDFGDVVQLVSDTNSSGFAVFPQVPEGPFTAYLSYLGFSAWISGNSLTQGETDATVVLSYPLMYAVGAFLVVLAAMTAWKRHRVKGRREQNPLEDYRARY